MKQINYLCIRIFHFGENFIDEMVAQCASAFAFLNRKKSYILAEAMLFAELVWLDLTDLGKEKICVGIHHLNTLQRHKDHGNKRSHTL
jgi:hypothetical protein